MSSRSSKNIWLRVAKHGLGTDGNTNFNQSVKRSVNSINVYTTNIPVNHWKITKIADDVWLDILLMLDWEDLIKIKHTCHHFNDLGSKKNSSKINRFWERESNTLCSNIEERYKTRHWDEFYINFRGFLTTNKYTKNGNSKMVFISNYWLALFQSCITTPNIHVFEMITSKFDDNTWLSKKMKSMKVKGKIDDGSFMYDRTKREIGELNDNNTVVGELLRLSILNNNLTMAKYILNRWPNSVNLTINHDCFHTLISFVTKCLDDELICLVLNHPLFDQRALIVKNSQHNLPFHNVFYCNDKHSNVNANINSITIDTLELLMNKTNDAHVTYHSRTDTGIDKIYGKNEVDELELMQMSNAVNETGGTNNNLTPLMIAVRQGQASKNKTTKDIRFLLTKGNNIININQRCFENKKTALMYAVEAENLKAVTLLLDKNLIDKYKLSKSTKTNIAFKDKNEQTVFHYAAKSGNVKLLLSVYNYVKSLCYDHFRKININSSNNTNNSLYRAYGISKSAKFIEARKGKGKNKNNNKRNGKTDYDDTNATPNMKARKWLLEYVNAPAGDDKKTPYIMACESGIRDSNFFTTLIDVCNVDTSIRDKFGRTGSFYRYNYYY